MAAPAVNPYYTFSPRNSLFFGPNDPRKEYWNSLQKKPFEDQLFGKDMDPVYIYDLLIYLLEIDSYTVEQLKNVYRDISKSDHNTIAGVLSNLKSISNPASTIWGAYRDKKIVASDLFKFEKVQKIHHYTPFLFRTNKTHRRNVKDSSIPYFVARYNYIDTRTNNRAPQQIYYPGYFVPQLSASLLDLYKSGVQGIMVEGMEDIIDSVEYENMLHKNEELRQLILSFQQKSQRNIGYRNVTENQPISSQILENISSWPYGALEDRKIRSNHVLLVAAYKWYMYTMEQYGIMISYRGWSHTQKKGIEILRAGNDITTNTNVTFVTFGVIPVIRDFLHIIENVDPICFPQTIEEAKEIVLEYLQYRLFYSRAQNNEVTVSIMRALKTMIVSFPFKTVMESVDTFIQFYQSNANDSIKASLNDIKAIDVPWFKQLLVHWTDKAALRYQGDSEIDTLSGFWVEYEQKNLENRIFTFLDSSLWFMIEEQGRINTEYVILFFYFAFYIGSLYFENHLTFNVQANIITNNKKYLQSAAYDSFIRLAAFPYTSTWDRVISQLNKIEDFSTSITGWHEILVELDNPFKTETDYIWNIYKTAMLVSLANASKKFTNYTKNVVVNYLQSSLTPSLIPGQNVRRLDDEKKNFLSWFSFYTLKNDYNRDIVIPTLSDLSYSLHANEMLLNNGIIPRTVKIPKQYTIRNTDKTTQIPLTIVAKFIPNDTVTLSFIWKMKPLSKLYITGITGEFILKSRSEDVVGFVDNVFEDGMILSSPISSGLYWCTVEARNNTGALISTGDSKIARIFVENLCSRCKQTYPLETDQNFDYFLDINRNDVCEWHIIPEYYMEMKQKRKYTNARFYDINTILADYCSFLVNTEPNGPDMLTKFNYTTSDAIYANTNWNGQFLPRSEEDDMENRSLLKDIENIVMIPWSGDSVEYDAILRILKTQMPYYMLLDTLTFFCIVAMKRELVTNKEADYYAHFIKIIDIFRSALSYRSENYTENRHNKQRKMDWITHQSKKEYIVDYIAWKNVKMSQVEKEQNLLFDRNGYEKARVDVQSVHSLEMIYPRDEMYHYYGKHSNTNELPDELEVVTMGRKPIFYGYGKVDIYNPVDMVSNAMEYIFVDPYAVPDVRYVNTNRTLKLINGSILILQREQLLYFKQRAETIIDDINTTADNISAGIFVAQPKDTIKEKLGILSSIVENYNKILWFVK